MESLFQLLFGYRPVVFQQGEFRLDPSLGSYVAALVAAVAIGLAVVAYRRVRGREDARHRLVLTSLRLAALALVLLCLFRPVLVVRAAVPQRNVLGILLDDSASMRIPDRGGQPRGAFVRETFGSSESPVMQRLAEQFTLRVFRFSSAATRLASGEDLTFAGTQTRLETALDGARQELAGLPVAGLLVVSDGADTTDAALTESVLALKAQALPVFTVGVGSDAPARDIEVDRVTVPKSVLRGTSLLLDVVIAHQDYAGETVTLDVEDEGRIVGSQQVQLPADGAPANVRIRALASEAGPRVFRVRVSPLAGELIAENNVREVLVDVKDQRERILYFEGEPRFELKFIRRAVADDENLQLVTLQRTADNKFLRLDVDNPDELIGGFPKTREELFRYRGLVLGSIEAGAFTGDQLRMIAEFVDRRGGGLLMLGGPRAFGEGGYGGTPVADVLPVLFTRRAAAADESLPVARLQILPTRAGAAHAVTQISATEAASTARWKDLPRVTGVNALTGIKPGATVLLDGVDERGRRQVALAVQRYGRGKAMAFAVQDSWLWQMHASMAVDDQTHENLWRQLLRWLAEGVPGPVEVQTTERVEPGEPVTLTASVVDPTFVELNDAQVVARVTRPDGTSTDVPMSWTGDRPGEYRATFVTTDRGAYEVNVEAARGGSPIGRGVAHVRAAAGDAEFFGSSLQSARLRRLAEETGGRFYTAETAAALPEDVRYAGRGIMAVEERELWHMPVVLALLVGLVCAEWGYRRAVGLA